MGEISYRIYRTGYGGDYDGYQSIPMDKGVKELFHKGRMYGNHHGTTYGLMAEDVLSLSQRQCAGISDGNRGKILFLPCKNRFQPQQPPL